MSKKEIVNEIFWLRAISCLAVVLVHSISESLNYGNSELLDAIRMIAFFGTPAFIFISEFLIAKSYSERIPKDFLRKRIKVLLLPFVLMGIIYAIASSNFSLRTFIIESIKNIFLADYVAYFIIIIFQFYILHIILYRYLNRWNPKLVMTVSLIINVAYLSFFNFVEPFNIPFSGYIWYKFSWYPFVGWIFYFVLGYYCGKHYSQFKSFLQKNKYWIILYFIGSLSVLLILWNNDFLSEIISSKRVDVLFFTISAILFVFLVTQRIKKTPNFIMFISKYSFSIYLLHKLFMGFIPPITDNIYVYTILLFVISLTLSILASYLLNKTRFGKYIVGRIVTSPKDNDVKKKTA